MKTSLLIKRISIVCLWITLAVRLPGGVGVPEPDTILYGKVVAQIGEEVIQLTDGELSWTIESLVSGGQSHTFETQLEPLAGGQYSYRINIPHELMAYDLLVSQGSVPLTAGWIQIEHLEITIDGYPAVILSPAENSFGVRQAARAMTHEVNLEAKFSTDDSDGDGLPDWLEQRNGLDRWDPADAALFSLSGERVPESEEEITTFGGWRAFHFPEVTGDLAEFAMQDSDSDGISNLEEYGFVLDPKANNEGEQTLQSGFENGRFQLSFRQRQAAIDLSYVLEVSDDLRTWKSADTVLRSVDHAADGMSVFEEATLAGESAGRFSRLKLILAP
jgi:hypothetical protein